MTEKEFEEKMMKVLEKNRESMPLFTAQEFFEHETGIPYEEFSNMKYAYIAQNQASIIEHLEDSPLDVISAMFERAFIFGYMFKGLDKED
jgi:hypothetical protein